MNWEVCKFREQTTETFSFLFKLRMILVSYYF